MCRKSKSIELDYPNSIEFSPFLYYISIIAKYSEVITDLRTIHIVETWLTLRIPKSSLTFVQIRADNDCKYDRKNQSIKHPTIAEINLSIHTTSRHLPQGKCIVIMCSYMRRRHLLRVLSSGVSFNNMIEKPAHRALCEAGLKVRQA